MLTDDDITRVRPWLVLKALQCGLHEDEAEDCVQDALLRLVRYRQSYDPERSRVSTWCTRVLMNVIRSRRGKGAPAHTRNEIVVSDVRAPASITEEHISSLAFIEDRLPGQARVLTAFVEAGYTMRQIGWLTGYSRGELQRAREAVGRALGVQ